MPILALFLAAALPVAADSPSPDPRLAYADVADLALPAPIAAVADVRRAARLRGERAAGTPPGHTRFFVEADVVSLLKGAGGLSSTVSYLVDAPNDARGRPPRLRGLRTILLARPVAGRPGEIQLVAPDAQLDWTPADEAQLRMILSMAARPDAPAAVTGIRGAFSVAGTLPGESETQIFVATQDGRPLTLSVLRRPGQSPHWTVSQSEVVDGSAPRPGPLDLVTYRLACGLPAQLPAGAVATGPEDARRAAADYRVVVQGLGPCGRTRAPVPPAG